VYNKTGNGSDDTRLAMARNNACYRNTHHTGCSFAFVNRWDPYGIHDQ